MVCSMALKETVAQNLRAIRAQRKISQVVLTKKCGLSRFYVSMIERGVRTPSLDVIERFAHALDVPLLALFEKRSVRPVRHR